MKYWRQLLFILLGYIMMLAIMSILVVNNYNNSRNNSENTSEITGYGNIGG